MERLRSSLTSVKRPVLWGFFISVVSSLLLVGVQWYWRSSVQNSWGQIERGRENQIRQIVGFAFYQRVQGLLDIASSVRADRSLVDDMSLQSGESILVAFERLDDHRPSDDVTIDIIDAVGNVVLWAGKSSLRDSLPIQSGKLDTLVALTRSGLHTYLTVSLPLPERFLTVVVSQPLEVSYPISNRFVTPLSFAEELSEVVGVDAALEPEAPADTAYGNSLTIPLLDFSGNRVGVAILSHPNQESELLFVNMPIQRLLSLVAGLGILCLALLLALFFMKFEGTIVRGFTLLLLLWGVRYAWLGVGFPGELINDGLFDPAHYGTPFGGGLTGSLGGTLITVAILLVSVLVLLAFTHGWRVGIVSSSHSPRFWLMVPVIGIAAFSLWLTHGFGEAFRSFVFDSTLEFQDATTLFPTPLVATMYVIMFFLTTAYLVVLVLFQLLMLAGVRKAFRIRLSLVNEMLILFVFIALFWALIQLLGLSPKFPMFYPFASFTVAAVFTWWSERTKSDSNPVTVLFSRRLSWLVAAGLVLSVPVLDSKLHQKDREELQYYADELARPLDSWLSFIANDGLRVAMNNRSLIENVESIETDQLNRHSDIAFTLWSQTLLSREGYNSAVVLYDSSGSEVSRFAVGLTSYEQSELLRAMFDAEEEVLQVVDRRVQGGAVKYYGVWSTLRDEEMRVAGFVAVMLSASQQALFRGEAPAVLRAVTRDRFETDFRGLTVSEYRDGQLSSTNDPRLYRGMPIRADVLKDFGENRNRFVWRDESVDGKEFEVLYARDEHLPRTVRALALEVPDIRWHVFHIVKMALIFVGVFVLIAFVRFLVRWNNNEIRAIGFRGRLFIAFSVVTVFSLLLIGYYNRELATERLESNINRRLAEDLSLLERRMIQAFFDEGDFLSGMTDDFCETVASEYGIDFSVYRSSFLKASSRPELYHATILDSRLSGRAYANTVLLGKNYFRDVEQIGEVRYAVGYKPLVLNDRIVGVLAVPALYRQREIDKELAYRNSYTVGVYALILFVVTIVGLMLANRLSRPLRQLTEASRKVGAGNLDVQLEPQTSDEVGELMSSFSEMVRELKESREQISRSERELAWKEMAKQVAHEIKNPLTPMKLSVQHLRTAFRDKASDLESLVERVTQTVIEQIDALSRIASEFSNFARMPERKFERVDLHHLLNETVGLFQEIRGVEFRTKFHDIHPTLVADGDELRRVFINLIRNSVQAMEQGGSISIETTISDHRCIIRLSDTGPGIPKNIQAKVFEPNFSTKTNGTGLGLAICKRIIEDLNGTIELESEPGRGTTFTIIIPLQASL